jgi:hypothetical protein
LFLNKKIFDNGYSPKTRNASHHRQNPSEQIYDDDDDDDDDWE